jgi:hypothetical protein
LTARARAISASICGSFSAASARTWRPASALRFSALGDLLDRQQRLARRGHRIRSLT